MGRLTARLATAFAALPLAFGLGLAGNAAAQDWPSQRIEMACATDAGSGAANWCLLIAELVGKELGQPVEVLFKPGGNGNEAAEYVASKPADGYAWLQRNTSYAGYMNLPTFRPDPEDFIDLVDVEKFLYVIAVPGNSKYQTFQELIDDMKANPGRISVASNKIGSIHHIHLIKLFEAFEVDWNFVPYEGAGGAMKDTLGGHVPVAIGPPGIWMPHVEAGNARFLLLLNEEKTDAQGLEGLPIPADFGKEYKFSHQVQGIFVKRGTPEEVQERIRNAFQAAVNAPEYHEYLEKNPHVVLAFSTDTEQNTRDFHEIREQLGEFLKGQGLIQ